MNQAVAWGRSLASDLAAYAAGELPWSAVDRGVLLVGPPGTGKTTYARALAGSCRVPLVSGSYAQWQSSGTGHLGDLLKAMRKTFEEARKQAPCILFIDELDSFHNRTSGSKHTDWWANVIGALLELMGGLEKRDGVVVVAATNHPDLVDPALKRSGRLDRSISIPLPDQKGLAGILRMHLGSDLPEEDLMPVAAYALGGSGADVERWVRGARRRARSARAELSVEHLLAEIIGADGQPVRPERHVVVHEAGHALLVALERPGMMSHASLVHRNDSAGEVVSRFLEPLTDQAFGFIIRSLLAGRAAEHVVTGRVTAGAGGSPESDLGKATRLAANAETALGFSRMPLLWRGVWLGADLAAVLLAHPGLARRVNRRLEREWRTVVAILRENRPALEALVAELERRLVLSGTEVELIVRKARARRAGGEGVFRRRLSGALVQELAAGARLIRGLAATGTGSPTEDRHG